MYSELIVKKNHTRMNYARIDSFSWQWGVAVAAVVVVSISLTLRFTMLVCLWTVYSFSSFFLSMLLFFFVSCLYCCCRRLTITGCFAQFEATTKEKKCQHIHVLQVTRTRTVYKLINEKISLLWIVKIGLFHQRISNKNNIIQFVWSMKTTNWLIQISHNRTHNRMSTVYKFIFWLQTPASLYCK